MTPPRASSAEPKEPQSPADIAAAIERFLATHTQAAVREDGKLLFDLAAAQCRVEVAHDRCSVQFFSAERNLVRRVVEVVERGDTLRLATERFGHTQTKLLELVAQRTRRSQTTREAARTAYLAQLEAALLRHFTAWKPEGFRVARDLEHSFGPAYARGMLVQGQQAWAVIGVNADESTSTIDGILTLGILWLHYCREHGDGRRLYQGLRVIVPQGTAALTSARLAWLHPTAAQWELYELESATGELHPIDPGDQGNLRTRLIHRPDEHTANERFADAIRTVLELVPTTEHARVEQRLRSSTTMVFLLHGLEFARAELVVGNSFTPRMEITVGVGPEAQLLEPLPTADQYAAASRAQSGTAALDAVAERATRQRLWLAEHIATLFERRRATEGSRVFQQRAAAPSRRIGAASLTPAHARMRARTKVGDAARDPLYRAAPERWLESMLRRDLAPLTRNLAPAPTTQSVALSRLQRLRSDQQYERELSTNIDDLDALGNRAEPAAASMAEADDNIGNRLDASPEQAAARGNSDAPRLIPRLDPEHVYAQVPAVAGASDRGMLDLLGVTADGRLAVIELKVADDLHFALQGLDYWIRVRAHHMQPSDPTTHLGEFQRYGYFVGLELSPLPPRLYLVAPALHIHPATETVLRYLSPQVEWHLLALDERWRSQIRVVWRRRSGL